MARIILMEMAIHSIKSKCIDDVLNKVLINLRSVIHYLVAGKQITIFKVKILNYVILTATANFK